MTERANTALALNQGREIAMLSTYRAFLIDKQGKAVDSKPLDQCKNDEDALKVAKQYVNGCDVQVWKATRLIGHLKGDADSDVRGDCKKSDE